jgi:hypothetical protein
MIPFSSTQNGDRELIELAFSKKKADDRKDWLRQFRVRLPSFVMSCAFDLLIAFAARNLPQSRHGRDFIFRFHQQGVDPVFHGRQRPLHPLSGGWPQAWSEKSHLGVFQTKAEERNQGKQGTMHSCCILHFLSHHALPHRSRNSSDIFLNMRHITMASKV